MSLFSKKKRIVDHSYSEWEKLINETVLGRNAYRDREILAQNLLDGRTCEWLAEEYNLSVRQITRIVSKRKKDLFKKIK